MGARFTFHYYTVGIVLFEFIQCENESYSYNFSNNLANMSYLKISSHGFCTNDGLTHCHVYLSSIPLLRKCDVNSVK